MLQDGKVPQSGWDLLFAWKHNLIDNYQPLEACYILAF